MVEKPWFLVKQPLVQFVIPLFTQKEYSPKKIVYNFKLTLKFQRCSMLPYFTVP